MSTEGASGGKVPSGLWPEGYDLVVLDEVDSTMAEARRRAAAIERPTWIMAHRQSDAKGRRGRTWLGGDGNLAATLVFRPGCTPAMAASRSFMAATALLESLALFIDRDNLAVKWPNDVLLSGGKVAGILLESATVGRFVDWLSVGVGVNLAKAPDNYASEFKPVCLRGEGGEDVAPEDFLRVLAGHFATQEAKLEAMGFARIREDWLSNAARLGEVITARTARGEITGVFHTVDPLGNLVLMVEGREVLIPAADVYF